jgi:hypothetical protein
MHRKARARVMTVSAGIASAPVPREHLRAVPAVVARDAVLGPREGSGRSSAT